MSEVSVVDALRRLHAKRAEALRVVAECDQDLRRVREALGFSLTADGFRAAILATVTKEMSLAQIAAAVNKSTNETCRNLNRLVRGGYLVKMSHGRYAPVGLVRDDTVIEEGTQA